MGDGRLCEDGWWDFEAGCRTGMEFAIYYIEQWQQVHEIL